MASHWTPRAPLRTYIRMQTSVDAELRRILLLAANDARKDIERLGPNSSLRSAQLRLQEKQLRMWAKVGNVIETGIQASPEEIAALNETFTNDLLKKLGVRSSAEFKRQMLSQTQNTINNYLARRNLGMTLSERVYKNGVVSSGRIDRVVSSGILRGSSAREIARDVSGLINPNTPGGISHAAMRLGRTELNNAFHQAANESYADNPFVHHVTWNLSGSHSRPDECNDLVGDYAPRDVPDKPHPQCLCYTTPQAISQAELVRGFKSGRYNEWADGMAA